MTPTPTPIDPLLERLRQMFRLESALAVLAWDQETAMPPGGASSRAASRGALSEVTHRAWVAPELEALVAESEEAAARAGDERWIALVARVRRTRDRKSAVPAELVAEAGRLASEATGIWIRAREDDDFEAFRPSLEATLRLQEQIADCLRAGTEQTRYDALMEEYDPGLDSAEVARFADAVRPVLCELVETYAPRSAAIDREPLRRSFDVKRQEEFGRDVVTDMGYDLERGRILVSAHPFCMGVASPNDVRITTRYAEHDFRSSIFGLMHEAGHALYEQGFDPEWTGTPLAQALSMTLHESQSRLWENLVGLSAPFWVHYFPKFQALFPDQLAGYDADSFLRALNRVEPSLIRVDADEVTYNLHILMRVEIEQKLFAGELAVKDLPAWWDDRMESDLGVRPTRAADGVLQDIHWSFGGFGYFPTYFTGSLYAQQFFDAAEEELGDLPGQLERGELHPLREWLREKVHRHGSLYTAAEVCRRATGSEVDPARYTDHLRRKLESLYGAPA